MGLAYSRALKRRRSDYQRRAIALSLAAVVHLIIFIMLIWLAPASADRLERNRDLISVGLLPEAPDDPEDRKRLHRRPIAPAKSFSTQPRPDKPAPTAKTPRATSQLLPGLEKFDLATLGSQSAGGPGGDSGVASLDSEGEAGAAPGGERLYNAEWHVRPTHAQLAFYLPHDAPSLGWGMIACRTIGNFRVDDCTTIGESPAGSGFAYAVQRAAWQFRVKPPRKGGKPLTGAWVRIRIEYTDRAR